MVFQKVIFGALQHFLLGQLSVNGNLFTHPTCTLQTVTIHTLQKRPRQRLGNGKLWSFHKQRPQLPFSQPSAHRRRVKHPIPRPEIRGNETISKEPSKAGKTSHTREQFSSFFFLKAIQTHISSEPEQAASSGIPAMHLPCSHASRACGRCRV